MTTLPDPHAVVSGESTVSGRIRALARAGYSRAEIAKLVDRSYQQVRQVLVDEENRQARRGRAVSHRQGLEEESRPFWAPPARTVLASDRLQIDDDGRLVLTPQILKVLDASPGDWVTAIAGEDGTVALVSGRTAMKRAQAIVRQFVPEGVSLVEELLAERKAEAERENRGD